MECLGQQLPWLAGYEVQVEARVNSARSRMKGVLEGTASRAASSASEGSFRPMTAEPKVRPLGVLALSILDALEGAFFVALGVSFVASAQTWADTIGSDPSLASLGSAELISGIQISAAFIMIIGAMVVINAYGLWKGKNWGWWMAMIFALMGAASSLLAFPIGLFSMAVEVLIIYYLARRSVRDYFQPVIETVPD